jgi:hypothetical protein
MENARNSSIEEWNDFQVTLAGKVTDKFSELVYKYDNNEISKEALIAAADAVFDSISGLAPWGVSDMVYAIKRELLNK